MRLRKKDGVTGGIYKGRILVVYPHGCMQIFLSQMYDLSTLTCSIHSLSLCDCFGLEN
jgi:hypothetical protein